MQEELSYFLETGTYLCDELVTWGNGTIPLHIKYYLSKEQPPEQLVSSVRAIVFHDRNVLVVTDHDGNKYVLPGGRRDKIETPLETLRREILEETGWTLLSAELLGFMHFHHLGPKPSNYEYLYPDFIWPIYIAEANNYVVEAIQSDDYVRESCFQAANEILKLPLRKGQLLLLEAALQVRRPR